MAVALRAIQPRKEVTESLLEEAQGARVGVVKASYALKRDRGGKRTGVGARKGPDPLSFDPLGDIGGRASVFRKQLGIDLRPGRVPDALLSGADHPSLSPPHGRWGAVFAQLALPPSSSLPFFVLLRGERDGLF